MNFQPQLHEEALRLLRSKGVLAESQSLPKPKCGLDPDEGPDDIKVTFGQHELWIYEDGANVLGPSLDRRFEIEDFDDLDHLKQAVLTFLGSLQVSV
jgi:hypothetical protein